MTGRENIYMNGSIMGMTKREITQKLDEIVEKSNQLGSRIIVFACFSTAGFIIGDKLSPQTEYDQDRILYGATQYFSNVREDLWDFCFAGYHGLQKWLKDRRQKTLSADEIQHIINVFNVFDLTETDMSEMDEILEVYGIV